MLQEGNRVGDSIAKSSLRNGARRRANSLRGGKASASGVAALTASLQHALSQLAGVTLALASSRLEVEAARAHIQTLTGHNLRLERELVDLAHREAQVRDFAYFDELTGLPNRRLLFDRLRQAIAHAARQRKQVVLLLLDLDGFKGVNDRLGHAGGDKLLQTVGRRLTEGIRSADTACRYGGDEFVVMLPDVDHPGMAGAVLGKLNMTLNEPYLIDEYRVYLTASMGAVVYPTDGKTDEDLIRQADVALYRAKARSGNARIEALPRDGA